MESMENGSQNGSFTIFMDFIYPYIVNDPFWDPISGIPPVSFRRAIEPGVVGVEGSCPREDVVVAVASLSQGALSHRFFPSPLQSGAPKR